jgi:integrase
VSVRLTKAIDRWLSEVKLSRSESTLTIYGFNMRLLAAFPDIPRRIDKLKRRHLIAFFNRPGRRSQNTQHQQWRTIRTFLTWCVRQRILRASPLSDVPAPPLPRPVPRHMRQEDIPRLLAGALASQHPARNHAMIMLLLDTGLRRGELVRLVPGDLDLDAHLVTIRRGKGGGGRQVPISTACAASLRAWLAVRPSAAATLFGLGPLNVAQMVTRCCERAGIPHISPHGLRHTFATYYSGDIYDVQRILGHSDVSTTANIYAHRSIAALAAAHDQRSPVGRL